MQIPQPATFRLLTSTALDRGKLFYELKQTRRSDEVSKLLRAIGTLREVKEWNLAISAFGRTNQSMRALEMLSLMEAHGIKANVVSYSAAMSAREKGKQWEGAPGLLQEMVH